MLRRFFRRKEKFLGGAEGKRRYDLPLNKSADSTFLILLIGLMTFLAMLALTASFTVSAMKDRWSSGLENKATIEIPADDGKGNTLDRAEIQKTSQKLAAFLDNHPSVQDVHVLSDQEISDLVRPWLGADLTWQDIPLPGMISIEIKNMDSAGIAALQSRLQSIAPQARLDTHEEWLRDLLRFTGAIQVFGVIIALIIGVTTITAISGAVRSRMAIYADEIKLLHLMGAADSYIARQFQRHSLILSLRGAVAGIIAGIAVLLLIRAVAGGMGEGLLPQFRLGGGQLLILAALPAFAALIAVLTTRTTVHRTLQQMP